MADAAHVLSDQLRDQLLQLGDSIRAIAPRLERAYDKRLRDLGFDRRDRDALQSITTGAAVRLLDQGRSIGSFFEEVEYQGRRLAKLNVPPRRILEAVGEYDQVLRKLLIRLPLAQRQNQHWVVEQLHFAIILTLNNAYYQVREGETEAFYRLSRVELESQTLDDLLHGFLDALVRACQADAGHLYFFDPAMGAWVVKASFPAPRPGGTRRRAFWPHQMPSNRQWHRLLAKPRQLQLGDPTVDATTLGVLDPSWMGRYATCWSVPVAAPAGSAAPQPERSSRRASSGGAAFENHSAAGGPIRLSGVMQLAFKKSWEWLPREIDLLLAAAERCLIAAEKAHLIEDLAHREETIRNLAEHMIHVEEAERRRISRELHDEAGQSMLCIRLALEMIEQAMPPELGGLKQQVVQTRDITEKTILDVRRLIAALSPAVLEQLGLGAALRQLINRFRRIYPCEVKLSLGKLAGVPQKVEIIVYRLMQECFNNIGKHSQATKVNISVTVVDKRLRLTVRDNGIGFDLESAQTKRNSFGLAGMRERVTLLGGVFEIQTWTNALRAKRAAVGSNGSSLVKTATKPGMQSGTLVEISIPLRNETALDRGKVPISVKTRAGRNEEVSSRNKNPV